jgi:hypothetical protein
MEQRNSRVAGSPAGEINIRDQEPEADGRRQREA